MIFYFNKFNNIYFHVTEYFMCCLFRRYIFNFSWYFRHIMHNLSLSFAVRLICLFYRTGMKYAIP